MFLFGDLIVKFQQNGENITIASKNGRQAIGTRLNGPISAGYSLIKKDMTMIDSSTISHYYNIESDFSQKALMSLGGRFIIYKDGTCELSSYGSGLPIISTEYKKLLKL